MSTSFQSPTMGAVHVSETQFDELRPLPYKPISADSHVTEPPNCYTDYIDPKWRDVAPHMIAQGYGKIINIGSGTAFRGIPWMLHYVTSKGGIMAMTRAMSRVLGDDAIRDNPLMPGFTLSDSIVNEKAIQEAA